MKTEIETFLGRSGDPRIRTYKADLRPDGHVVLCRWIIPPGRDIPEPDAESAYWMDYLRVAPIAQDQFGLEYKRHDGNWHLLMVADSLAEVSEYILENEHGLF